VTSARRAWLAEITARGLSIGALNAWGNPLHPDPDIAAKHDADLRDTIRLAAALGVDRVVALAGCPAGVTGDRVPHFAGGGWLPYLESVYEAQWESSVEPYWSSVADFAQREHPALRVCLELHPGTVVYNVETFSRVARLGSTISANIDPSHFIWMGMDALAVVEQIGSRAAHCHGKDVAFLPANLAVNGLLDHRWPRPAAEMPWNFAVVGRGKDQAWWERFRGRARRAWNGPLHLHRAGGPVRRPRTGDQRSRGRALRRAECLGHPRRRLVTSTSGMFDTSPMFAIPSDGTFQQVPSRRGWGCECTNG
jgi:sugar phosphate isomerase/epimerase